MLESVTHLQLFPNRRPIDGIQGGSEYFYIEVMDAKRVMETVNEAIIELIAGGQISIPT